MGVTSSVGDAVSDVWTSDQLHADDQYPSTILPRRAFVEKSNFDPFWDMFYDETSLLSMESGVISQDQTWNSYSTSPMTCMEVPPCQPHYAVSSNDDARSCQIWSPGNTGPGNISSFRTTGSCTSSLPLIHSDMDHQAGAVKAATLHSATTSPDYPLWISSTIVTLPGILSNPVASDIDVEASLSHHYKSHMSKILSVKDTRWNIFSYLLQLSQGCSRSPLRSSLIAWAGLHLAAKEQTFSEPSSIRYAAASHEVNVLLEQLIVRNPSISKPFSSSALVPNTARMLLAALFFLCQYDIMNCNRLAFTARIEALKRLLSRHWDSFRETLEGMDYRLLLWLACLDVRGSAWGRVAKDSKAGEWSMNLLEFVAKKEMVGSLYLKSRSYLDEAFGDCYPSTELRGDMLQDPVNIKEVEAMSLLSRIISFENNHELRTYKEYNSTGQAWKSAELQEIRADLTSLRNVCMLAFLKIKTCSKHDRSANLHLKGFSMAAKSESIDHPTTGSISRQPIIAPSYCSIAS